MGFLLGGAHFLRPLLPPLPMSLEIILDLPFPTSTNRLHSHRGNCVHSTKEYIAWQKNADAWVLLKRQYPKQRIVGPFEIEILLDNHHRGDGDNRIKAVLDWLQSREIIRNDIACRKGRWEWVPTDQAPVGCRVILRSQDD
jgi:Holliday junction resolvase RusA-like endonuclease